MTDEQFVESMIERREVFDVGANDHIIGCPLCLAGIPLLEEEESEAESSDTPEANADGAANDAAPADANAADASVTPPQE
jgi:hypothetical protein